MKTIATRNNSRANPRELTRMRRRRPAILRAILARRADPAKLTLRTHIEGSKAEVRKITIHKLHSARPARAQM